MEKDSVCEEQVFHRVHKKWSVQLRNFLYYKFGDMEKAKDFAQEAFGVLWKNCTKVSESKAKSYLYTVAGRLFLDDIDKQKVRLKFRNRMDKSAGQMDHNPEYLYREEEFKERLEAAISDLSEHQRTVFLLSRIDKLKNKEIAETLNISIKTVEKHISNSLKHLKQKLDDLENTKI